MTGSLHRVSTKALLRLLDRPSCTGVPVQLRMRSLFQGTPGKIFSMFEVVDYVYADQENGGPDNADQAIKSALIRLHRKGVPIVSHGKRGWSFPREQQYAAVGAL